MCPALKGGGSTAIDLAPPEPTGKGQGLKRAWGHSTCYNEQLGKLPVFLGNKGITVRIAANRRYKQMKPLVTQDWIDRWRKILVDAVCFTAPEDIDTKVEIKLRGLINELGRAWEDNE